MRLTEQETQAIRAVARRRFGEKAVVRLFGSRVDDARSGGDIDIHITTDRQEDASLKHEVEFLADLEELIGERKVDLVVRGPEREPDYIDLVAEHSGVRL
jgi:predicted nucleotidyltransferase